MLSPLRSAIFAALACLALLTQEAYGTLLVLPNNGWTAGAPAPSQTVSQTFTQAGVPDVTITLNNNGSSPTGGTWLSGYPSLDSVHTTGGYSGETGLQLVLGGTASTSAYILTTVSFASPVTNVSFQIWDVDRSASAQFIDTISSIQALSNIGAVQAASSVTSAVPGYNTVTGSGLTYTVSGTAVAANNTNQGTINISFSGPITQFSFRWSNNDPSLGQQAIGLGEIDFTPVPEVNALWPSLAFLGLLGVSQTRRRRSRKLAA